MGETIPTPLADFYLDLIHGKFIKKKSVFRKSLIYVLDKILIKYMEIIDWLDRDQYESIRFGKLK